MASRQLFQITADWTDTSIIIVGLTPCFLLIVLTFLFAVWLAVCVALIYYSPCFKDTSDRWVGSSLTHGTWSKGRKRKHLSKGGAYGLKAGIFLAEAKLKALTLKEVSSYTVCLRHEHVVNYFLITSISFTFEFREISQGGWVMSAAVGGAFTKSGSLVSANCLHPHW